MKVILKTRVPKLGNEWDIVTVKDGHARNFLFPKNLAEPATPALIKKAEELKVNRVKKAEDIIKNAKEIADKLSKSSVSFSMKAKDGKLYGSITEKDIAEAILKEHKVEVGKEMVVMSEHIKSAGDHKVKLQLADKVSTEITVKVEEEK